MAYDVLFLCTGNSAHSLPLESLDRLTLRARLEEIGKPSTTG